MIKTAPKAYSYCRFSTKIQKLGDSERRQLDKCKAWCLDHHVELDESLGGDVGVSGFRGRNSAKGVLATFLGLVKGSERTIKTGSILLIENIDRLSRQNWYDAFSLLQEIVEAGITLAVIDDHQEYSLASLKEQPHQMYVLLGNMQRANAESQHKSERITQKWGQIHSLIRAKDYEGLSRLPQWKGGVHPNWLKWVGGKKGYDLDPPKAAIMRRVVKMSLAGMGAKKIAATFNREGIPSISKRTKTWDQATIGNFQRSRTLLGEHQICRLDDQRRQIPVGEPVKGFYKPLLDVETFNRLQAVLVRHSQTKRGRTGFTNLFGRLLLSGHDGATMTLTQKQGYKYLRSSQNIKGLSEAKQTFPYFIFESHFLKWISEVPLSRLNDSTTNEAEVIEGTLLEVQARIGKLSASIMKLHPDKIEHVASALADLTGEESALKDQLQAARIKTYAPQINTADIAKVLKQLEVATPEQKDEIRSKLRMAISSIVREIRLYIYISGAARVAIVHTKFLNGSDKVFLVRKDAKTLAGYCDDLKWKGYQIPDEICLAFCELAGPELAAGGDYGFTFNLVNFHPDGSQRMHTLKVGAGERAAKPKPR
jgi:DNA invertase Pin-like site-specific DNA recombinase